MSNLISRQAAIDALDALCDRGCEYSKKQRSVMCGACHLGSAFDVIEQLPSVQPENKELLAWQEDFQAYIKMLNLPRDDYNGIMEYIDEVPSAQPERKTGEWQEREDYNGDPYYTCTSCGESWYTVSGNNPYDEGVNFCPN